MTDEIAKNSGNSRENPLTCIREAYTLAATPDAGEVDELMVRQFLNTLAEVALLVASRQVNR